MNIREIHLDNLLETMAYHIENRRVLDDQTIELVDRILFGYENRKAPKGDIIFVFGNPTCLDDRIVKAVELLKAEKASRILLSGGVLLPGSDLTEALAMKKYCLENGILDDRILLENKSTTTYENVLFSAPLINSLGKKDIRIIAVSSATHMRRVLMNFHKFGSLYPSDMTVVPCHSIHPTCSPKTWYQSESSMRIVLKELSILKEYLYVDLYPDFEI